MRTLLYFCSFERDRFPELTKAFFVIIGILIIITTTTMTTTTATTHDLQEHNPEWRDSKTRVVNYKNPCQHRCFSIYRPWKWLFILSPNAMILQCYHTHKHNSEAEAKYFKTLLLWMSTTSVKSNPEIYH